MDEVQEEDGVDVGEDLDVRLHSQDDIEDESSPFSSEHICGRFKENKTHSPCLPREWKYVEGHKISEGGKTTHYQVHSTPKLSSSVGKETKDNVSSVTFSDDLPDLDLSANVQKIVSGKEKSLLFDTSYHSANSLFSWSQDIKYSESDDKFDVEFSDGALEAKCQPGSDVITTEKSEQNSYCVRNVNLLDSLTVNAHEEQGNKRCGDTESITSRERERGECDASDTSATQDHHHMKEYCSSGNQDHHHMKDYCSSGTQDHHHMKEYCSSGTQDHHHMKEYCSSGTRDPSTRENDLCDDKNKIQPRKEVWPDYLSPLAMFCVTKKKRETHLEKSFKRTKSVSLESPKQWPESTRLDVYSSPHSKDNSEDVVSDTVCTSHHLTDFAENLTGSTSICKEKGRCLLKRSCDMCNTAHNSWDKANVYDNLFSSCRSTSVDKYHFPSEGWRKNRKAVLEDSVKTGASYSPSSNTRPFLRHKSAENCSNWRCSSDTQFNNDLLLESPNRSNSELGQASGIPTRGDHNTYSKPDYEEKELRMKQFDPGFIDTHCHIDFLFQRLRYPYSFARFQLDCQHTDPFPVSYEGCVAIFCKPWTFKEVSWWEDILLSSNVWAAFGCHPHFCQSFDNEAEVYLKLALQNSKTVALGEIGLDYSNKRCYYLYHKLQQSVFSRQLRMALLYKKPIVIHCREAHRDCIEILKENVPRDYLIHLHCFTGTWVEAKEWFLTFSKLFLGFTNLLTYSNCQRSYNIREVVKRMPLDRLLIETDAPYFRPRCYSASGKFSHPGMAIHVAAQVCSLRNEELQDVLKQVRQNTRVMYGI